MNVGRLISQNELGFMVLLQRAKHDAMAIIYLLKGSRDRECIQHLTPQTHIHTHSRQYMCTYTHNTHTPAQRHTCTYYRHTLTHTHTLTTHIHYTHTSSTGAIAVNWSTKEM